MMYRLTSLFWFGIVLGLGDANAGAKGGVDNADQSVGEEGTVVDVSRPLEYVNSVHEALLAAYHHNAELIQLRHRFRGVLEGVNQARSGFMPKIWGEVSQDRSTSVFPSDRRGEGGHQQDRTRCALVLEQNIFNGGVSVAGLRDAEHNVQIEAYKLKSEEQHVFEEVIKVYLDIVRLKSEIEAFQSSEEATLTSLEVAQNKLNIGEETRTQVALAESRLSDVRARLQMSYASLDAAEEMFMLLTGCRLGRKAAEPVLPHRELTRMDAILEQVDRSNLEILLARTAHRQAKARVDRAKGEAWYPTVDLRANVDHDAERSQSQVGRRSTNHSIGISVRYKFFGGGEGVSKINQAHAESASRRVSIESERNKVRSAVVRTWKSYRAAQMNVKEFEIQVKASEVSLEGTKQEMVAGVRILYDVLQRQSELLEAQRKLIEARKNFVLEGFRLMSLMGRLNVEGLNIPVHHFPVDKLVSEAKNPATQVCE